MKLIALSAAVILIVAIHLAQPGLVAIDHTDTAVMASVITVIVFGTGLALAKLWERKLNEMD